VKRLYDAFGVVIADQQEHSGTVNGSTLTVSTQYTYLQRLNGPVNPSSSSTAPRNRTLIAVLVVMVIGALLLLPHFRAQRAHHLLFRAVPEWSNLDVQFLGGSWRGTDNDYFFRGPSKASVSQRHGVELEFSDAASLAPPYPELVIGPFERFLPAKAEWKGASYTSFKVSDPFLVRVHIADTGEERVWIRLEMF
jgi:hypothetical protein